ncbi:hypothetical protein K492DRAFT_240717 [Lichtheimia hyalospora FSU 10163]|nr:hypothetical protein K492DRAFT_240717 [Lichtheimia hyalospora FSU 10163]
MPATQRSIDTSKLASENDAMGLTNTDAAHDEHGMELASSLSTPSIKRLSAVVRVHHDNKVSQGTQEDSERRIDFISQLPVDIVLTTLIPMLADDLDNLDASIPCPYLHVSTAWRGLIIQCLGGLQFSIDSEEEDDSDEKCSELVQFAQHTKALSIEYYEEWMSGLWRNSNFCSLKEISIALTPYVNVTTLLIREAYAGITYDQVVAIGRSFPSLKDLELTLRNVQLNELVLIIGPLKNNERMLNNISNLHHLRRLVISSGDFDIYQLKGFPESLAQGCPELDSLRFNCEFSPSSDFIDALKPLEHLKEFAFSIEGASQDIWGSIQTLSQLQRIEIYPASAFKVSDLISFNQHRPDIQVIVHNRLDIDS